MTPQDYIQEIDDHFYAAKRKNLSRLSEEWGKWSTELNLGLRKIIETAGSEIGYRYAFYYWTNRSQLLEAHYRGKLKNHKKISSLKKEASKLLKIIKQGNDPKMLANAEFPTLAMLALSGMKLKVGGRKGR